MINPNATEADQESCELLNATRRLPTASRASAPRHKRRLALGAVTADRLGAFWGLFSHVESAVSDHLNPDGVLAKGQEFFAVVQDLAGAALGAGLTTLP
ncbi:hypothetical protein ACFWCM_29655 [Streptomyces albidoflavus]